jgi:hypothetical protein
MLQIGPGSGAPVALSTVKQNGGPLWPPVSLLHGRSARSASTRSPAQARHCRLTIRAEAANLLGSRP